MYLFFGLTGEDPPASVDVAASLLAFGASFGWPLLGSRSVADVVRRGCRLGLLVTVLLPVVAVAVLLLWENAQGRRDLGMGGLILYNVPFIGLGLAAVLAVVFGLGARWAVRR